MPRVVSRKRAMSKAKRAQSSPICPGAVRRGVENPRPLRYSTRRVAKRTTVTPARAWRVLGMTSTQSS